MAAVTCPRMVACVVGLSRSTRKHSFEVEVGIGKSCLCYKFMYPQIDDYNDDHRSLLALHEFESAIINNNHFLYWGNTVKGYGMKGTEKEAQLEFHVVEQTVLYQDVTLRPFNEQPGKPNVPEYYIKRIIGPIESSGKISYKSRDALALPSHYQQYPSGISKYPRGYLVVVDVSQPAPAFDDQFTRLEVVLDGLVKHKKKFIVAITKRDEHIPASLEKALTLKRKYHTQVIETSAKSNLNIEAAFQVLAHKVFQKKIPGLSSHVPSYEDAVHNKLLAKSSAKQSFLTFLKKRIVDSDERLRVIESSEEYKLCAFYQGKSETNRMFAEHILELYSEKILQYTGVSENPDMRQEFLEGFVEQRPDLVPHMESLRRWIDSYMNEIVTSSEVEEQPDAETEPSIPAEPEPYHIFQRSPDIVDLPPAQLGSEHTQPDHNSSQEELDDSYSYDSDGPSSFDHDYQNFDPNNLSDHLSSEKHNPTTSVPDKGGQDMPSETSNTSFSIQEDNTYQNLDTEIPQRSNGVPTTAVDPPTPKAYPLTLLNSGETVNATSEQLIYQNQGPGIECDHTSEEIIQQPLHTSSGTQQEQKGPVQSDVTAKPSMKDKANQIEKLLHRGENVDSSSLPAANTATDINTTPQSSASVLTYHTDTLDNGASDSSGSGTVTSLAKEIKTSTSNPALPNPPSTTYKPSTQPSFPLPPTRKMLPHSSQTNEVLETSKSSEDKNTPQKSPRVKKRLNEIKRMVEERRQKEMELSSMDRSSCDSTSVSASSLNGNDSSVASEVQLAPPVSSESKRVPPPLLPKPKASRKAQENTDDTPPLLPPPPNPEDLDDLIPPPIPRRTDEMLEIATNNTSIPSTKSTSGKGTPSLPTQKETPGLLKTNSTEQAAIETLTQPQLKPMHSSPTTSETSQLKPMHSSPTKSETRQLKKELGQSPTHLTTPTTVETLDEPKHATKKPSKYQLVAAKIRGLSKSKPTSPKQDATATASASSKQTFIVMNRRPLPPEPYAENDEDEDPEHDIDDYEKFGFEYDPPDYVNVELEEESYEDLDETSFPVGSRIRVHRWKSLSAADTRKPRHDHDSFDFRNYKLPLPTNQCPFVPQAYCPDYIDGYVNTEIPATFSLPIFKQPLPQVPAMGQGYPDYDYPDLRQAGFLTVPKRIKRKPDDNQSKRAPLRLENFDRVRNRQLSPSSEYVPMASFTMDDSYINFRHNDHNSFAKLPPTESTQATTTISPPTSTGYSMDDMTIYMNLPAPPGMTTLPPRTQTVPETAHTLTPRKQNSLPEDSLVPQKPKPQPRKRGTEGTTYDFGEQAALAATASFTMLPRDPQRRTSSQSTSDNLTLSITPTQESLPPRNIKRI